MPGCIWNKGGEEWQEYVTQLLKIKYGATQFQDIPDRDRGDYGIEGFSRDGTAYQCYVAEEPLTIPQLYGKQRDKITIDLKKFINNSEGLSRIFGPTKISCWILIVPHWESKSLLEHAEKKAKEVREAHLPYVANHFYVHIATEEDFAIEKQRFLCVGLDKIRIEPINPDNPQIEYWCKNNGEFVKNLERKISDFNNLDIKFKEKLCNELINHYLRGQNTLDKLRVNYPIFYQKVIQEKNDRQTFLTAECMYSLSKPVELFREVLSSYKKNLESNVSFLDSFTIDSLSYEAVSDWLLRCPLEFIGA